MRENLLSRETRLSSIVLSVFLLCFVTAIFTIGQTGTRTQVLALIHFACGAVLSVILIYYLVLHFIRTLGMRRPLVLFTGVLGALLCLLLIFTGFDLGLIGQREDRRWIYNYHYIAGFLTVFLVALHLIFHWFFYPEKRKTQNKAVFLTIPKLYIYLASFLFASLGVGFVVYQLENTNEIKTDLNPITQSYEYSYGSHPFRPSQTETSGTTFIHLRDIANSKFCANCHTDIAAQWQASIHRQSASDTTYVSNVNLLEKNKGIAATRYCEGCHAPIALLTGELTPGGKHGGVENTPANIEGVSCTSCHRLNTVVHTKGVASFEFVPATDYLFQNSDFSLGASINEFLIKAMPAQHKQEMAMQTLADPKMCATCHAQFMDADMNGWGWVKMQDEYSAWLESPYAAQHEQRFASSDLKRCQDCHMPLVAANDPSADKNGMVRDHRFLAANTMVPAIENDDKHLKATEQFLQNNKIRVSIEKPYRENPTQNLQALSEDLRSTPVKPWYFYKNETAKINVIVSNIGVGHDFPGGTVDINQSWVHFLVTDAEGYVVYESGSVDQDDFVEPTAYFYKNLPVDRKGQLVWRHDLFNKIGEVSRNTIKAGESDVVQYEFTVPSWVKSPLLVSSSLKYRKLNTKYARWALKERYEALPITEMARAFLNVSVRDQVEAKQTVLVSKTD